MIDARDTIHLTCAALFGELHAQVTFHTTWDYAWVVHDIALFADAACTNLLADDIHLDDFTAEQQRALLADLEAAEAARRAHFTRPLAPTNWDMATVVDEMMEQLAGTPS
jgi:hypothetical protein